MADAAAESTDTKFEHTVALSLALQTACQAEDADKALAKCKTLLDEGALAWFQEEHTGWTALHYAAESGHKDLVNYLLRNGAVWNLVDVAGFTASDVAYSNNDKETFNLIVMEGVRMEMLKAILSAQIKDTSSESMAADDADQDDTIEDTQTKEDEEGDVFVAGPSTASDNKAFLASRLRFETDEYGQERCVDSEGNGVMMGWEAPIMQETARLLLADKVNDSSKATEEEETKDLAVLNVGFGLGLIDMEMQKYKPTRHVIVEPHPDVLAFARSRGWYDKPGVQFFEGTWRQYIEAFESGDQLAEFDAIYFDTFSEHYADLHAFFSELPNLLRDDTSRFSFFHGLGATSMTFYEVYTHVSEMHLNEIGLKTEWYEVDMNATEMGETTWQGITRRYWNIPSPYRLPICHLEF